MAKNELLKPIEKKLVGVTGMSLVGTGLAIIFQNLFTPETLLNVMLGLSVIGLTSVALFSLHYIFSPRN